jgi:hypothetical protein
MKKYPFHKKRPPRTATTLVAVSGRFVFSRVLGGGNEKTVVPGGREVFPASGRPPEQQEMILENETEYPILAQGH